MSSTKATKVFVRIKPSYAYAYRYLRAIGIFHIHVYVFSFRIVGRIFVPSYSIAPLNLFVEHPLNAEFGLLEESV